VPPRRRSPHPTIAPGLSSRGAVSTSTSSSAPRLRRAPAVRGRHHVVDSGPPNPPGSRSTLRPSRTRTCPGAPRTRRRLDLLTESRLRRSSDWTTASFRRWSRRFCAFGRRPRLFARLLAHWDLVEGRNARCSRCYVASRAAPTGPLFPLRSQNDARTRWLHLIAVGNGGELHTDRKTKATRPMSMTTRMTVANRAGTPWALRRGLTASTGTDRCDASVGSFGGNEPSR